MAAASSEDSNDHEKTGNSKAVLGDLFSELQLDFCVDDFANYIKVDASSQVKAYENIMEDMLFRLDEFCQTADMVRNESGMFMTDLLPRIIAQSKDLPPIFEKIDQVERFITIVHKNIDQLEEQVTKAEKDLGGTATSTVKGFLSSLPIKRFRQKKEVRPADLQWTPVELTDLKQYFEKDQGGTLDTNTTQDNITPTEENNI